VNILARAAKRIAGALVPARSSARALTVAKASPPTLSGVDSRGGWWPIIRESFSGAWQADIEVRQDQVMAQSTVFACMTLIASDIGKLRLKLVEQSAAGIWSETDSPAFSPVLRKPNRYQTRQKFIEQWIVSKLSSGNAYALKQRDMRGVVTALYILDPQLVTPLVATNGEVYYQLQGDDLSQVPQGLPAVPASEIIHDRMVCLFHPLVGVSPIYACGLAATQGLKILQNSAKFFQNMSRPSGILTAPTHIDDDTAKRLKDHWEQNFSGDRIGKVAVLGDGLKYEGMSVDPVDAQLVEQLKLSAEQVCSVFHVPPYMVGAAPPPAYNNIEALNQQYYSQCLQALIESVEAFLDEGLGLVGVPGKTLGTEFEIDDLLRMDTATLTAALKDQVAAGITKPNEARRRLNLAPVAGGDTPYLQQQNYSLAALDKRDQGDDPFGTSSPAAPPAAGPDEPKKSDAEESQNLLMVMRSVSMRLAEAACA
jgi:HK97 family phage portal protein